MNDTDIATAPEGEMAPSIEALGSNTTREFLRYFVASAIALVTDAGSLVLMTSLIGIPYLYSGAVAFLFGLTVIYVLSIRWVFEARSVRDWRAEFSLFALIGIVGLLLNEFVLWILTGELGFHYMLSKGASVVLVFLWNFLARKSLLFKNA